MELTKLIEQCCEEKGLPSFMVKGLIKEVENEKGTWLNTLLEWLASRPTCGKEQREFLDTIEKKGVIFEYGLGQQMAIGQDTSTLLDSNDFSLDLAKVINGE